MGWIANYMIYYDLFEITDDLTAKIVDFKIKFSMNWHGKE